MSTIIPKYWALTLLYAQWEEMLKIVLWRIQQFSLQHCTTMCTFYKFTGGFYNVAAFTPALLGMCI